MPSHSSLKAFLRLAHRVDEPIFSKWLEFQADTEAQLRTLPCFASAGSKMHQLNTCPIEASSGVSVTVKYTGEIT